MSHVEVPKAAHRGELSELRGGGATEQDALPSVRAEERGASTPPMALSRGDRVTLSGRVSLTGETSEGVQWVTIALDGEPEHVVACWTSNTTRIDR